VSRFAVARRRGHAWDHARGMREQDAWPEHAEFMDALAEDGFVVLGGPLGDGERILLIVEAESESAIHDRLAADPWTPMGLLRVESVESWEVLLGADRFRRQEGSASPSGRSVSTR
jgi:uncharacterized protein YciI